VELYGSLRIRAGQAAVAMRADTIRTAMELLLEARPELKRLLPGPERLPETHRFSINGLTVTTDLDTFLSDGDRVVLFSASVGG
jgi:molybdopterin converting factor small subunit